MSVKTQIIDDKGTREFLKMIGVTKSFHVLMFLGYLLGFLMRGLGITLMIPLAKGLIERDYSFIFNNPIVKWFVGWVPQFANITDTQLFIFFAVTVLVVTVMSMAMNYGVSMYIWKKKEEYSFKASMLILEKYLSPDTNFFVDYKSSQLRSRLEAITRQTNKYITLSQELFQAVFEVATAFVVLIFISPFFSGIASIFFILSIIIFYFVRKVMRKAIVQLNSTQVNYASLIQDILGRQSIIHIFNKQKDEYDQFEKTYRGFIQKRGYMERINGLIEPIFTIFQMLSILAMGLWLGNTVLATASISVPAAIVFIILFQRGMNKSKNMSMLYINKKAIWEVLVELVEDIITKLPGIISGTKTFTSLEEGIDIKNLSFAYGNKKVIEELNAHIPALSLVAITGPNGSGKTTLLSLILRLRNCPPRTIFVDGIDIHEYDIFSWRDCVAYVAQDITLFNDSLRNNIAYGSSTVSDDDVMRVITKVGLTEMVHGLAEGLDTNIGDAGIKLSGGQRQRIVIARALLRTPEIIIFDEATKSVDAETEKLIMDMLVHEFKNTTRIVVTHNPHHISLANSVITLK